MAWILIPHTQLGGRCTQAKICELMMTCRQKNLSVGLGSEGVRAVGKAGGLPQGPTLGQASPLESPVPLTCSGILTLTGLPSGSR